MIGRILKMEYNIFPQKEAELITLWHGNTKDFEENGLKVLDVDEACELLK